MTDPKYLRVHKAWRLAGPNPQYHERQKQKLRKSWPALADALDGMGLLPVPQPPQSDPKPARARQVASTGNACHQAKCSRFEVPSDASVDRTTVMLCPHGKMWRYSGPSIFEPLGSDSRWKRISPLDLGDYLHAAWLLRVRPALCPERTR